MRFEAGQIVGRYRVEGLVGRGGMGEVYRACAVDDGAVVAIKALRDDGGEPTDDATRDEGERRAEREALEARFGREGRLASRFRHPRFCGVVEVGEGPRGPYLVMEWVAGRTLRSVIPDTVYGTSQRLEWLLVLAEALADAHRAGIVHRDFKPGNVMITESGAPKILDFGLAKRTPRPTDTQAVGPPSFRTATGAVLGTARYMSPEQLAGAELAGPASDQFAWGVTAYEVLSGLHPALALERGSEPFPVGAPRALGGLVAGLPSGVGAIVARTLSMLEADRYASMDDVARELRDAMVRGAAPTPTITEAPRAPAPGPSDPTLVDEVRSSSAERPVTRTASMASAPRRRDAKKRPGRAGLFWISVGVTLALAATGAAVVAISVRRLEAPRTPTASPVPEIASVSAAPSQAPPRASETVTPPPRSHPTALPPRSPHAAVTVSASVASATATPTPAAAPHPRRTGPRVLVVSGVEAFGSGYDSLVVRGVFDRARPEMEQCYRALTYDGRNDTQVGVIAYVEESGVTSKVEVSALAGVEPSLRECLLSAGRKMRFPPYPRSRPAIVRAYLTIE